jgi:glycosyltransferase involved in cell wall biosynthesis
MNIKILQISPQVPLPLDDGGKISIYGITKCLSDRGHEIHFVCYLKDADEKWTQKKMSEVCKPYLLNVNTQNKLLPAIGNLPSQIPYNVSKFIRKEMKQFLKEFFSKNQVDIVHIDNLHMAWCIDEIKKYSDAPIVLRQHNLEMKIMQRFSENTKNPLLKIFAKVQARKFMSYEPAMCQKMDMCLMITKQDELDLLALNNKIKAKTLSVGVDDSLFKILQTDYERFSLFHIGNLNWLPNKDGLDWFIEKVLTIIVNKIPAVKLYVYGKNVDKISIPKELNENIIRLGYVENIWAEIINKNLAIVPLRIGSGIRIKIIELLAAGYPVISTSIGKEGLNLITGLDLLVADSPESFAENIVSFFLGKIDRESIIKNGREKIFADYSWSKIGENLEKLYTNLINQRENKL